jgi:UDPglucose--hexose-1-phosphate uridylyltransferase
VKIVPGILSAEPVLLAPERARRPHAFSGAVADRTDVACPFCPGNEDLTPPSSVEVRKNGAWTARAFPNKYPASQWHEVIVDGPDHNATFDRLNDPRAVLRLYANRYGALMAGGASYVCLFKNHGAMAGASIAHPHSQALGVPFLPPRIRREAQTFRAAASCPLCAAISPHQSRGLVIAETASFVWLAPESSTMAHEQWLVPRRHQHEISALNDEEVHDLAVLLGRSSVRMSEISSSFNWLFMNFPQEPAGHFYVDLFPRRTSVAGFELATGTFIEVIEPLETARAFREGFPGHDR